MTYNEWRDELKSNLLCVSEAERRRVLDYYAEAYADRRDAGFTEREIIEDFGAPYDAAQRILGDSRSQRAEDDCFDDPPSRGERRKRTETRADSRNSGGFESYRYCEEPERTYRNEQKTEPSAKKNGDLTWVFVLLCIIFCVPLFGIIVSMAGVTVGVCVAPFAALIGGVGTIIAGISAMVTDGVNAGLCEIGVGIIISGISIALIPLFIKLIKLMWKLFGMFFNWLKSLFSGKENA